MGEGHVAGRIQMMAQNSALSMINIKMAGNLGGRVGGEGGEGARGMWPADSRSWHRTKHAKHDDGGGWGVGGCEG